MYVDRAVRECECTISILATGYSSYDRSISSHQPWGAIAGQATDVQIQAEEVLKDKERLNQLLAEHTGQPLERISEDTERDRYMTAEEAKEYGLVDEILTHEPAEKK